MESGILLELCNWTRSLDLIVSPEDIEERRRKTLDAELAFERATLQKLGGRMWCQ